MRYRTDFFSQRCDLKRVIVTPAVYPRLVEFLHFDIQSRLIRMARRQARGPVPWVELLRPVLGAIPKGLSFRHDGGTPTKGRIAAGPDYTLSLTV